MLSFAMFWCLRHPWLTLFSFGVAATLGAYAWRDLPIDALPDLSPRQVLVEITWHEAPPSLLEERVTQPLAARLRKLPGIHEVRGMSGFGHAALHLEFERDVFELPAHSNAALGRARSAVQEEIHSLLPTLPADVDVRLGPAATAMGQVLWYSIEGVGTLAERRALQDSIVKPALEALRGVAEVASCGGFETEFEVVLDPALLDRYRIDLEAVMAALSTVAEPARAAWIDAPRADPLLRLRPAAFTLERLLDLPIQWRSDAAPTGSMATTASDATHAPATAAIGLSSGVRMNAGGMGHGAAGMPMSAPLAGEATRRSAAHAGNSASEALPPLALRLRDLGRVQEVPARRVGALADERTELVGGVVALEMGANPREVLSAVKDEMRALTDPASRLLPPGARLVPFYDRSTLIDASVGTLTRALKQELWITIACIGLFLLHLKAALLIAATLPLAVLICFLLMQQMDLDANLMSLTGIAVAIGTMVDLGIVMTESCYRALIERRGQASTREIIRDAARDVALPLATATATTVLCFLPLFFLQAEEGLLFRPLVWTKTFALLAAAATGLFLVPVLCAWILPDRERLQLRWQRFLRLAFLVVAPLALGLAIARMEPFGLRVLPAFLLTSAVAALLLHRLVHERLKPLHENPVSRTIEFLYAAILKRVLARKAAFLALPVLFVLLAAGVGLGAERLLIPVRWMLGDGVRDLHLVRWSEERFPGLQSEFLPPLNEGALLYMPSLLPGTNLAASVEVMEEQNRRFAAIPEVVRVVAKAGRAETALDPAPVGMIETLLILKSPREWRAGLTRAALEEEVLKAGRMTGLSGGRGALLQPIETRIVMLSSGLRSPLALRLSGSPRQADGTVMSPTDAVLALDDAALALRRILGAVDGVRDPALEQSGGQITYDLQLDAARMSAEGLRFADVASAYQSVFGGLRIEFEDPSRSNANTVLRVRLETTNEDPRTTLARHRIRADTGQLVALNDLAEIEERDEPVMIESIDGRIRQHLSFAANGIEDRLAMERALEAVSAWRAREVAAGRVDPIPRGVRVEPAGRYVAQERARGRLMLLVPICLGLIFLFVALCLRSITVTLFVFAAIPVVWSGGVLLMAIFPTLQTGLVEAGILSIADGEPLAFTVAVVVGFVALFGLATDDGVIMATYLRQRFASAPLTDVTAIRAAVLDAGLRRIRPCLMTTLTTIVALLPVLIASGHGSELARPMAVPIVGGMCFELLSLFILPCLYCWRAERQLRHGQIVGGAAANA